MPQVSRYFIFSSFGWLLIYTGLPLAAGMAESPVLDYLAAMSLHMFTLGFLTQMILGVALWMFPRSKTAMKRELAEKLALIVFVLLNSGLVLRHAVYLLAPANAAWQAIAGIIQFSALLLFTAIIWNRMPPLKPNRAGAA